MRRKLLLCNESSIAHTEYDVVISWSSCKESENSYSIPQTIEDNADQFKLQYLDWIYALGRKKVRKKNVVKHLSVREDFSLWWMSLIFEKSQWKSPRIYQVFQLLALESILRRFENVGVLDVEVDDKDICRSIEHWCSKHNIVYKNIALKNTNKMSMSFAGSLQKFPHVIRAMGWLTYYTFSRWPKKNLNSNYEFSNEKDAICIVSYFFNLDSDSMNHGFFYTKYWTKLHQELAKSDKNVNWIHLFVKSDYCPTSKKAEELVDGLNKNTSAFEKHGLIDQNLDLSLLVNTLKDYWKLILASYQLRTVGQNFRVPNSEMNFWTIMSNDWKCSLFGKTAMANCLYLNIFEKIFKNMPKQNQGLYLLENQPWERAMIYAWKKNNHGQIVGVPHTVVSYWDLRHFYSVNEYHENTVNKIPLPDAVALNGDSAISAYQESGFSKDKIKSVEALRYLYLKDLKKEIHNAQDINLRLLVIGDCDPIVTNSQIRLLTECLDLMNHNVDILIKPHPLFPINCIDYPEIDFDVTSTSLGQLTSKYDIAFASNPTAAAVDIYLSNKKVLIMQSCNTFNMSPLRGSRGVEFVKTAEELAVCLSEFTNDSNICIDQNFFFLNNELPKWKMLLNI
jgi:surface carbohydrate biosynthesis protein (TIGR04326 family)